MSLILSTQQQPVLGHPRREIATATEQLTEVQLLFNQALWSHECLLHSLYFLINDPCWNNLSRAAADFSVLILGCLTNCYGVKQLPTKSRKALAAFNRETRCKCAPFRLSSTLQLAVDSYFQTLILQLCLGWIIHRCWFCVRFLWELFKVFLRWIFKKVVSR